MTRQQVIERLYKIQIWLQERKEYKALALAVEVQRELERGATRSALPQGGKDGRVHPKHPA